MEFVANLNGKEMHVTYREEISIDRVFYNKKTGTHEAIWHKLIVPKVRPEQVFEIHRDGKFYAYLKMSEADMKQEDWLDRIIHHALNQYPGIRKFTNSVFTINNPR